MRKKKKPGRMGRVSNSGRDRLRASAFRSVADLDAAEAPAVTIPEALANHPARGRLDIDGLAIAIGRAAGGNRTADDGAADQAAYHACGNAALRVGRCRGERTSDGRDRDEG